MHEASYEVTAGVRDSMEKLSDAGAETIRNNPEEAGEILGVPFSPVTRLMTIIGIGVVAVMISLFFYFTPVLRCLRSWMVLRLRSVENRLG